MVELCEPDHFVVPNERKGYDQRGNQHLEEGKFVRERLGNFKMKPRVNLGKGYQKLFCCT